MKRSFFPSSGRVDTADGCTTTTLTKFTEKNLDGNSTRMLRAILNKSWWQHPRKQQLYDHLPPITKTIQVRRTRHSGHCWRSRDEFLSDILRWTPLHGRANAERISRAYVQQLCADTGCSLENLTKAMDDREGRLERVMNIHANGATWWWWWWWWYDFSIRLPDIGIMSRVFTNGPEDRGSIPGRVIPKTQKCYLMPPCLTGSIIRYVSRVKLGNPGKGVSPSRTRWCSRYKKRSLRVTFDYGRQLYFYYEAHMPETYNHMTYTVYTYMII